jgi:coenzyme PQQ precursor peptide PqqA
LADPQIGAAQKVSAPIGWALGGACRKWKAAYRFGGNTMKIWTKPEVREQEVGLEVTSYLPAEIDLI